MNDEQTVPVSEFQKLAATQMQRALSGDSKAADWCAKHAPTAIAASMPSITYTQGRWPWGVDDLDTRCQAALKEQYGQFSFARAIADDLAKLPEHALFALHQGFHELEDRGLLRPNVSTETREQLEAACRLHENRWKDVCEHVAALLSGNGGIEDLEKLAVSIAAIGGWKKELTHQMYASIRAGSTNPEISAEVGKRLERIIGKLNEELELPPVENDPAGSV